MTVQNVSRFGAYMGPVIFAYDSADIGQRPIGNGMTYGRARLPGEFTAYANLTLSGLVAGSDIVILEAGTITEKVNVDANAGTTYVYNYGHAGASPGNVDIGVFKAGYVPFYIRNFTLPTTDALLPVAQDADRNYSNPA